MLFLRFLLLIIILNLIRYFVIGIIEEPLILPYLFNQMELNVSYFNTSFSTLDWITSYFYNFMMWLSIVWIFHLMHSNLRGHPIIKSLKVFGIMWLFFASVSTVYMNHYSHPKEFYLWNILDAFLVFGLMALANAYLYPLIIKKKL